ncbi:MAG: ornithine carbamoyltransferase [Chloroflexi bacterium RBG_16_50_11]|nr:MAG: ornithine carbamoyltransferase [Chloroflexi bacterium RBG_16_50_11]
MREVVLKSKDFLSISDLTSEGIRALIANAAAMKAEGWNSLLSGKVLVLLFEKPSLRTRVSFEIGMRQLGGQSLYLSPEEVQLGKRESIPDAARVLSRYADVIAVRTFAQETLEILANNADIPVINALSDLEHPCQALADILTIYEHKETLDGLTIAFIGDGNNTAHSLMLAAALCGIDFRIASPKGYRVQDKMLKTAQQYAAENQSTILCTEDPRQAITNADVVYTDVWVSMGQEEETKQRRKAFASYQVNSELLSLAKKDAILMHPLPAHHGEEVAENLIYCQQSVIFDQAENRLHAQKAILAEILGGLEIPLPGYHR